MLNNSFKKINLGALMILADTAVTSEIKKEFKLDLMPSNIKEVLMEIKTEKAKDATRAAAMEIYSLLEIVEKVKLAKVMTIRHARQMIKDAQGELENIAASEVYAGQSSNYLPLYKSLGLPVVTDGCDVSLFNIPEKARVMKKPTLSTK